MPVIRGMLLFEEQMKLKIHSTGFCLNYTAGADKQQTHKATHKVKSGEQLRTSSGQCTTVNSQKFYSA